MKSVAAPSLHLIPDNTRDSTKTLYSHTSLQTEPNERIMLKKKLLIIIKKYAEKDFNENV